MSKRDGLTYKRTFPSGSQCCGFSKKLVGKKIQHLQPIYRDSVGQKIDFKTRFLIAQIAQMLLLYRFTVRPRGIVRFSQYKYSPYRKGRRDFLDIQYILMSKKYCTFLYTVCPRSSDAINISNYYIKWGTTSLTYSSKTGQDFQDILYY